MFTITKRRKNDQKAAELHGKRLAGTQTGNHRAGRSPSTQDIFNGVGTNFGVGVEEARPEGPRARDGVLGRGQPAPPQLGVCGSAVSSLSGVRGGALAAEGFSCILSRQIAFPISERVAHSLHG